MKHRTVETTRHYKNEVWDIEIKCVNCGKTAIDSFGEGTIERARGHVMYMHFWDECEDYIVMKVLEE